MNFNLLNKSLNFSHIPKFEIFGCDETTPLNRNLILEIQMDQKEIWQILLRVSG
jgi:hypothetical protein